MRVFACSVALGLASPLGLVVAAASAQSPPPVRQIVRDNPYEVVPGPANVQRPPSSSQTRSGETELLGAAAHALYDAGSEAFADKRFAEAALHFEAAAADKPNAIALYTAALSWERASVPDRAADDFGRALTIPGLPPDQAGAAAQRLAYYEGILGAVSVTGSDEWRVQLDGNTELSPPVKLHAAPGAHTLVARRAGHSAERLPVVLVQGTTAAIHLEGASSPSSPPLAVVPSAPPPPVDGSGLRRTLGVAALGAAGTALPVGILLGVQALDARDAFDAGPSQAAYDHVHALQAWTNVAFVSSGVLLATGLALVFWPWRTAPASPPAASAPALVVGIGPGGASAEGIF
jgi:hypothetical protein